MPWGVWFVSDLARTYSAIDRLRHPAIKPLPVLLLTAPSVAVAGQLLQPADVVSTEKHQRLLAALQNLIAASNGIEPSWRTPPRDLSAATKDANLIR